MKPNVGRFNDALDRLLPLIIVIVIVTFAYFWFLQAPLNAYVQSRADVAGLDGRVKALQAAGARAVVGPPVDIQAPLREYERQMSSKSMVAEVTAALAKAVLDVAPPDKLREFAIETGDRVKVDNQNSGEAGGPAVVNPVTGPDLRLSLFPGSVSYTPVKITFNSTFEAIASLVWNVRDLPTIVEVKSATLTRGLPLMKFEMMIWVYQRSDLPAAEPVAPQTPPAAPPTAPRVAQNTGAEG